MKELIKQKKLERMYRSWSNLKEDIKKKHLDKFESTNKNKNSVDKSMKNRAKQIVDNKDKWYKAIEEHQQKVKHNIMLKQELRKLREQDILKVKERNKRLETIKKNLILEKQLLNSRAINDIKLENELLVKKLIDEDIKDLRSKDQLDKTLINLSKSLESSELRNKMLADNKFNISISERLYKKTLNDEELS